MCHCAVLCHLRPHLLVQGQPVVTSDRQKLTLAQTVQSNAVPRVYPPLLGLPGSLSPPDLHLGSHCWRHTKLTSREGKKKNGSGFRTIHSAQTRSTEPLNLHWFCCRNRCASSSESEKSFNILLPPFDLLFVEMTLEIIKVNWFIVPYNSYPSSSSHTLGN